MAMREKTRLKLVAAIDYLEENHPATVRQVYYSLVARQVVENNQGQYDAIIDILRDARLDGTIPWEWIEDRTRRPRPVQMFDDLPDFLAAVRRSYRRDVWANQPTYVEVWLEKDALSGIFEDVLRPYGITLCVGRGFDGWTSLHDASVRYRQAIDDGQNVVILYFGDFDPSGDDMVRSWRDRQERLGLDPDMVPITKCALTRDDIARYQLPTDFAKKKDSRSPKFIAKNGDVSVELDALNPDVIRERLTIEIERHMDLEALDETWAQERSDRDALRRLIDEAA